MPGRDLTIGSVDDRVEHEADRVAEQVMRIADRDVSLTTADQRVSRKCAECEEEDTSNVLRAKSSGAMGPEVPAIVHEVLRSPGQPLDSKTRGFFEPRFQRDFSDVRIHADAPAAESARSINALGYTVGRDVVFAQGRYSPGTDDGRRLIAHELAHVVQQAPSAPTRTAGAAGVIRRKPAKREWGPDLISTGIAVFARGRFQCSADANATGSTYASGIWTGDPRSEIDTKLGNYASVCLSPCVGEPLNLRPTSFVDAVDAIRPKPFDPPTISFIAYYYPDVGDMDVLMKETSTGEYTEAGGPLDTTFGDLTFFTPDSPGRLVVSSALTDPTSGQVAVYSEEIRVIECPRVAVDPEPVAEKPKKPPKGRETRFYIEVRDPVKAPLVYQLVDKNTSLDGPGGLFQVWKDTAGKFYYMNNGRRVYLPNFSP
jgi:hypothetical protein